MTFPGHLGISEPSCGWQELSQRELSIFSGRSDGLVGHIEAGRTQGVSAETAAAYCRILGITIDWLQTGEGPAHRGSEQLDAEIINSAVAAARAAEAAA